MTEWSAPPRRILGLAGAFEDPALTPSAPPVSSSFPSVASPDGLVKLFPGTVSAMRVWLMHDRSFDEPKSKWGDGPWQAEPDMAAWQYAGSHCLLLRNGFGAWCGYVGLKEGHPLVGKPLGSFMFLMSPHGGVTWSGRFGCELPELAAPPDVAWWIGFDCGHAGDFPPGVAVFRLHRDLFPEYRDMLFARTEVELMALAIERDEWRPQ